MGVNEQFRKKGYYILRNFMPQHVIDGMYKYLNHDARGEMFMTNNTDRPMMGETWSTSTEVFGGIDSYYHEITKRMELILETRLLKTYHMGRVYGRKTSGMEKHVDRVPCETSITFPIAFEGDEPWPIWLEDLYGERHEIELNVGDVLIYKGCDCLHWREPNFFTRFQMQYYMHWIDAVTEQGLFVEQLDTPHGDDWTSEHSRYWNSNTWPYSWKLMVQKDLLPLPKK